MRIAKTTLVVAWLVGVAFLQICMFVEMTAGEQHAPLLLFGIAAGICLLTTVLLLLLREMFPQHGSLDLRVWVSVGPWVLGGAALSLGGLLSNPVRFWAGVVFLTICCWVVQRAIEGKARPDKPARRLPPETASGWTSQQFALELLFFGVIAIGATLKCLLFGPSLDLPLAYFIGPGLIAASYLVDCNALRHLLGNGLKPPEPPAGKRV